MFDIFKKSFSMLAPISGKIIDLSDVPDKVFAERLVGDGAAIDSTGDTVYAPADGQLTLIFRTNHAFGMTLDNGIEVLVHIGIDTVELEGYGFERLAEQGSRVKAGDPIIRIDRQAILDKGCSLITPVLITNKEVIGNIEYENNLAVQAGRDIVFTYKLK